LTPCALTDDFYKDETVSKEKEEIVTVRNVSFSGAFARIESDIGELRHVCLPVR
jgi:hypothetical protein